jgi:putative ABC transport system permease protein
MASPLQQIGAVTATTLLSLPARWGGAAVVVVCLAGVSGVMTSMLAMAEGLEQTYRRAGRADRVIVMTTGETNDGSSSIARDQLPAVFDAPGLVRRADGTPAASVERYTTSTLPLAKSGEDGNVIFRGVSAAVLEVRPEVRIAEGRLFKPGLREVIVGRSVQRQFRGVEVGNEVSLSGVSWTVVGIFASDGSALESEAWGDVEAVMSAYNQVAYSAVLAQLAAPESFQAYKDALTGNPALSHTPMREDDYLASQSGILGVAMRVIGYVVASIMALGAVFAAVNTMYASIESRGVEIATLRALGFGAAPIAVSVLLEGLVLCLAGSVVGGAVAWLLFNGYTASTLGAAGTQLVFAFSVSPALLVQGAVWACVIGLLGGLPPALRAARLPVAEALRTT